MFTFKKQERLCKKTAIDELFVKGNSFFIHPFKVLWQQVEEDRKYPIQILINVPKRNFKKAVDRNYLKRLCREAYRKNKIDIYKDFEHKNLSVNLALIYVAKEKISYHELEEKTKQVLERLKLENEKNSD